MPAADLPTTLAAVAAVHARRARSAAARCAALWPIAATAVLGGGVVLVYIMGVAVPAKALIDALARPLDPGPMR